MYAEFEDWHSEVKWMQQTPVWPAGFKAKFKIEDIPWSYTCLLVQPCHMISYLKDQEQLTGAPGQHLTIARLQRFVTATSRITMQQRLQLVFQGYRARFAQIGVGSQGLSQLLLHHMQALCIPVKIAVDFSRHRLSCLFSHIPLCACR